MMGGIEERMELRRAEVRVDDEDRLSRIGEDGREIHDDLGAGIGLAERHQRHDEAVARRQTEESIAQIAVGLEHRRWDVFRRHD